MRPIIASHVSAVGLVRLLSSLCLCAVVTATDLQAAGTTANQASPPGPAAPNRATIGDTRSTPSAPGDESSLRNAAARTRLNECGHQWSAKKRNGSAVGTWKDFFKTCLAHQ